MRLSISTRWNAYRHDTGEAMIDEILALGLDHVELSYDLRMSLVPGVKARIDDGSIKALSVHNFCPVPVGVPHGHPEIFSLCSLNERERKSGVEYTTRTAVFAAEVGAGTMVVHAGNIAMKHLTRKLITLAEDDKQHTPKYEKIKMKLLMRREKKAQKHIDQLYRSLEEILPDLESNNVILAMENLPSWEAVPTEVEMEKILNSIDSPFIKYWHDMGHGRVLQNLGFTSHLRWLTKLMPHLAGMHVHDVIPPACDHLAPPKGELKFEDFKPAAEAAGVCVMEPAPGTHTEDVVDGINVVRKAWS